MPVYIIIVEIGSYSDFSYGIMDNGYWTDPALCEKHRVGLVRAGVDNHLREIALSKFSREWQQANPEKGQGLDWHLQRMVAEKTFDEGWVSPTLTDEEVLSFENDIEERYSVVTLSLLPHEEA